MYLGATIFPGWYNLFDLRKNPEDILIDDIGIKLILIGWLLTTMAIGFFVL